MNNDLSVNIVINRVYDAEIEVFPTKGLSKRQKKIIEENSFHWFPFYYANRIAAHNLLEPGEVMEYKTDKSFLSGEACLFFKRELERFDVARVKAFEGKKNIPSKELTGMFVSHLKTHLELMCRKVKDRHLKKRDREAPDLSENEEILYIEHDLAQIKEDLEYSGTGSDMRQELNILNPRLYEYFVKKAVFGYPERWLKIEFNNKEELNKLLKGYSNGR